MWHSESCDEERGGERRNEEERGGTRQIPSGMLL
jgi:hypothetical protein